MADKLVLTLDRCPTILPYSFFAQDGLNGFLQSEQHKRMMKKQLDTTLWLGLGHP
jgi:hypothetical protein